MVIAIIMVMKVMIIVIKNFNIHIYIYIMMFNLKCNFKPKYLKWFELNGLLTKRLMRE